MSNMPKALDPFWEYGEAVGGANQAYISCNLCGTKTLGGITRLKYHLAKLSAYDADVMPCMVSSAEAIQKAREAIAEQDRKKDARERPMVSDR